MEGPITVDVNDLKLLVKHEIELAYRSREEFLWKKGQTALRQLQEEAIQHDSLLLEQVGCLQSGLETLAEQQKELRTELKEMTLRVSTVVCDVQDINSGGNTLKNGSQWYCAANWSPLDNQPQAPYALANQVQANPQTAPMAAQSHGTSSEVSKLSTSNTAPAADDGAATSSRHSEQINPESWELWRKQAFDSNLAEGKDPQRTKPSSEWTWEWDTNSWPEWDAEEWETWSITLYKTAEVPFLGADIHDDPDGTIVLDSILAGGLLDQYNKAQSEDDLHVIANDRLISINGKSGHANIRSECHKRMKLDLTILHRRLNKGKLRANARSFEPKM